MTRMKLLRSAACVALLVAGVVAGTATSASAVPAYYTSQFFTLIHSNARIDPGTVVGAVNVGDEVYNMCWVTGDTINGNQYFWDLIYDKHPNVKRVGFVNELYVVPAYNQATRCTNEGRPVTTHGVVWQHSGPSVSAAHVGDVGLTSNLRAYAAFPGDLYNGSNVWWIVFDPHVYNGVAGFVSCTDLDGVSCSIPG